MQTQRDHVHAHQFQMVRMSSALVLGDPAGAEDPAQRSTAGVLAGAILAVLVLAGFGVYGWIVPGGDTSWRTPGTLIVEKETGVGYVLLGGRLHPARNRASAMLLLGAEARLKIVTAASLKDVPRGGPVGLADAPVTVPAAGQVLAGPWLVCPGVQKTLLVAGPGAGGEPLATARFAIVRSGDERFLLWQDHRYTITGDAVPMALGADDAVPVPAVPGGWLALLPDGGPVGVPGTGPGGPSRRVGGHTYAIGQLFVSGASRYVLRADGLAPLGDTAFRLLAATRTATPISAADVVAAPRSADRSLTALLPGLGAATPATGANLCLSQRPDGDETVRTTLVSTGAVPPAADGALLAAGSAMIARPIGPDRPASFLITDEGRRYRLADTETAGALKLTGAPVVPMPAAVLDAVPAGPTLSRAAATGGQP